MNRIADLLFEAHQLKALPRSGYHFLGAGDESVAEHTYMTTFIGFVLAQHVKGIDPLKLMTMCLLHDLPEARIGDINYVQKQYVTADETAALADQVRGLFFGDAMSAVIEEFNAGESMEAMLARDADQLSMLVDLKSLSDLGHRAAQSWVDNVRGRLKTDVARDLCEAVLAAPKDRWWRKNHTEDT